MLHFDRKGHKFQVWRPFAIQQGDKSSNIMIAQSQKGVENKMQQLAIGVCVCLISSIKLHYTPTPSFEYTTVFD